MADDVLITPEAFGVLQAMKRIDKLRLYDPSVADELTGKGLAELQGKSLVITKAGRLARKKARQARHAALKSA
ncbi:hypothetical protein [Flaviflagellibacter deserti]|uniref:Uncharacterized protein n=1 Tax=Flaviflagellibacter deserti TaxID=2267266 RepID=A0ABV9Z408_9HYPH